MANARDILLNLIGRETVSGAAKKAADGLDDLGDAAKKAAKDTSGLDRELDSARKRMLELQREAGRTGDLGIRKAANAAARDVKQWEGLKKSLADAGDDSASGFAASFSQRIGPLVAKAPISPPLIAALAASAPALSAIVSGAIAGGAAVGAVGIGAAIISQRDDVQEAAGDVGERIMKALQVDATPMVKPVLAGIAQIEGRFHGLRPTIRRIFSDSAGYVPVLTDAVGDAAETMVDAFADVVNRGAPIVDMLGRQIPRTAEVTANALRLITDNAGASADALDLTFTTLQATLTTTAATMKVLNTVFQYGSGVMLWLNQQISGTGDGVDGASASMDEFIKSLRLTGGSANAAAVEVRSLAELMDEMADKATNAFNAETKFGEVLDEVTRKTVHHNAGLDANTAKGRANREALAALAAQARASAEAIAETTGGQQKANAIMSTAYGRFIRVADAMGVSKREAGALARALGLIPPNTDPRVRTHGVPGAINEAQRVKNKLEQVERTYFARVVVNWDNPRNPLLEAAKAQANRRAKGGPVKKNRAYIVGEERPEVFVPDEDGTIVPSIDRYQTMSGGVGGAPIVIQNLNLPNVVDGPSLVRELQRYSAQNGEIRGVRIAS